eukprot:6189681-Pleurochrysis_carterae.AAC.2
MCSRGASGRKPPHCDCVARCAEPSLAVPIRVLPPRPVLCYSTLCYAALRCAVLRYAVLCSALLRSIAHRVGPPAPRARADADGNEHGMSLRRQLGSLAERSTKVAVPRLPNEEAEHA